MASKRISSKWKQCYHQRQWLVPPDWPNRADSSLSWWQGSPWNIAFRER